MKPNVGTVDRIIRFLVAVLIAALYYLNVITGAVAVTLLVIAGIFVVTSFVGFCPLYWPLGISTARNKTGKA